MTKSDQLLHEKRRGWLRNGNPPGDFTLAPRCKAKTRRGKPCQCPAMKNGRCRLHGGLSTGPNTREGIERIRWAVTKHGEYSAERKAELKYLRNLLKQCRESLRSI
ncbi:MAG TPA: HGGxSTG domain-containing protein [Acidobacteriota bacterium]|nr:HGGxSTG domain-containing protein [Acidobacteriota bacterium]